MSYFDQHLRRQKTSSYPAKLIEYVNTRFGLGGRVADMGCGLCGYTKEIGKHVQVDAYDIGVIPAEIATPRLRIWSRTNLENPVSLHPVTTIWSKSVIEHLRNPDVYLLNARQALGPGGTMFLMTPDWKTCKDVFYDDYTHVRPYTQESLKDQIESVFGRGTCTVELFWQVPISWKFPLIFKLIRPLIAPFAWGDLGYRLKHAALLSVTRYTR